MGGTPAARPAVRGRARHRQDATLAKAMARRGRRAVPVRVRRPSFQSHVLRRAPRARSARTSRRCARPPARRAARSASSRRSTRSAMARGGVDATGDAATACAPASAMCCGGLERPAGDARAGAGRRAGGVGHHAIISEGIGGVVNELLVQMQSLRRADRRRRSCAAGSSTGSTCSCRRTGSCARPKPPTTNVLLIAATNRADNLDPALLRPGPVRPAAHLRAADQGRPPRADRPLPGDARRTTPSWTTTSSRDALAADHAGLHAGDDRAPLRRGAGQRAAPRRGAR